jgi:release factor glutamine methyltransferase
MRAPTWRELRLEAEAALAHGVSATPAADARWLVVEVSGFTPGELALAEDEAAPARAVARLDQLVARRRAGEPLQYVLGTWSFRGLDLMLDPRVLIPRPETEVVVETAIAELVKLGARTGRRDPWSGTVTEFMVADLGTGSGAIALALASELPDAQVWACDVSDGALAVARANLASIASSASTRVRLAAGSWFDALPGEVRGALRAVVSNPPYVAESEVAALAPEVVDHEPRGALVSGPTGREDIEYLLREAPAWLEPGGVFVCELAPHQAAAAADLARALGYASVEIVADLAGRDRVLVARV